MDFRGGVQRGERDSGPVSTGATFLAARTLSLGAPCGAACNRLPVAGFSRSATCVAAHASRVLLPEQHADLSVTISVASCLPLG
jgi:hypothetical protein